MDSIAVLSKRAVYCQGKSHVVVISSSPRFSLWMNWWGHQMTLISCSNIAKIHCAALYTLELSTVFESSLLSFIQKGFSELSHCSLLIPRLELPHFDTSYTQWADLDIFDTAFFWSLTTLHSSPTSVQLISSHCFEWFAINCLSAYATLSSRSAIISISATLVKSSSILCNLFSLYNVTGVYIFLFTQTAFWPIV